MVPTQPTPLAVKVRGRRVPAVLWRPDGGPAPLVLFGHGGSGHKTSARQLDLADRLVAAGLAVVAIDGPLHGERADGPMRPGEYQSALVARGIAGVVRDMTDDWLAAIDAAHQHAALDDRLGYLGLSMGTRFGLPLAAALGPRLGCAVLGKFGLQQSASLHPGLHVEEQLRQDAARVAAPTLWHAQWDDELFARAGQLAIFDALGAADKRLLAFPGDHAGTAESAMRAWIAFIVEHLSPDGDASVS